MLDGGEAESYKRNRYSSSSTISEWKESFIRKSLPTLILASPFTEEEKIFFFFYIFRAEGEFHYAKQTQWTSWITNKCSSSSTLSECKGSFIRKSLPAQILAPPLTEEEIIFFFFYNLWLEREFHDAIQSPFISFLYENTKLRLLLGYLISEFRSLKYPTKVLLSIFDYLQYLGTSRYF